MHLPQLIRKQHFFSAHVISRFYDNDRKVDIKVKKIITFIGLAKKIKNLPRTIHGINAQNLDIYH